MLIKGECKMSLIRFCLSYKEMKKVDNPCILKQLCKYKHYVTILQR